MDRDELIAWVAIHEITHAVQFSGAPWLREHLGSMLRELLDGLQLSVSGGSPSGKGSDGSDGSDGGGLGWLRDPGALFDRARDGDLRVLIDRARRGELLRLGLGDERWRIVERMQATMSLIEGHAEHTMDAVGAEFLPSLPRLRAAMTRRRESRGLPWRVLERLLGLELKMRQYEVGRRSATRSSMPAAPRRSPWHGARPPSFPARKSSPSPICGCNGSPFPPDTNLKSPEMT